MADRRTLVGAALALLVLSTLSVAIAAPVSADPSYDDDDPGPCPGEPDNEGVDMNNDGYINLTECAPIAPSFGDDIDLVAVDADEKVYVGGGFDASPIYVDGARVGRHPRLRHTEPPVGGVATADGRETVRPRNPEFVTPDGRIDVSKVERARANGRKTVKARDA